MNLVLPVFGTIGLLLCFPILLHARCALRRTTLTIAVDWLLAGFAVWLAAFALCCRPSSVEPGTADLVWYAAAVFMLCPGIAVLGAKRPGSRVWTVFVLVPLLVVLGWPALTVWQTAASGASVTFEEPVLVGYAVVMLMGAGNYLLSRHFWPVTLLMIALILVIAPMTAGVAERIPDRTPARLWATVCLFAAMGLSLRQSKRRQSALSGADRVWFAFRDNFGIVWSKRIMDRVNHTARKEDWPAKLTANGFVWCQPDVDAELRTQTDARIEQTVRWLLQRFVDTAWLDEHLQPVSRPECFSESVLEDSASGWRDSLPPM